MTPPVETEEDRLRASIRRQVADAVVEAVHLKIIEIWPFETVRLRLVDRLLTAGAVADILNTETREAILQLLKSEAAQ
jgi:hypothetical protein